MASCSNHAAARLGLAVLAALAAPAALANPTGAAIQQGSAAVAAAGATLTVTSTPGTVIEWQRFVIAPGETTRFIGSSVVNRVPTGFSVLGNLESTGQVYFLTGSQLSGRGLSLDLAGLLNATFRFDSLPSAAREGTDGDIRAGQALSNGKVFIIGPGERPGISRSSAGAVMLAPGMRAELGDLRVPFVRVHVAAPPAAALDVDALVARRPQIGIFNALFLPAETRRGETGASAVASVSVPARQPGARRSKAGRSLPVQVALAAPVQERLVLPLPPAPVVERGFAAAVAPVEERIATAIVNEALVEERTVIAAATPSPLQAKLLPAVLASLAQSFAAGEPAVLKEAEAAPLRVAALVAPAPAPAPAIAAPVVVVAAADPIAPPRAGKPAAPVRLAAVQKRMPRIMFDRKGAIFHM